MAIAPFLFWFSWHHLWIFNGSKCVHFIEVYTLFFLRAQIYTFSSTFIQTFVWHHVTMPRFEMFLGNLFIIRFLKFLVLYLDCGCIWLLILRHKWIQVTSYPMPMNKKLEGKDHQIDIPKWSVKICNFNFIRVIKMVLTFQKIIWWRFLVPRLENVSILAV